MNCTVQFSSVLLFGCFLSQAWGCFCLFRFFFCTEVVVYIDTSPYFCEHQTDNVIGAEAWEEAGPGESMSCHEPKHTGKK